MNKLYTISLSAKAKLQLSKLNKSISERITRALERLRFRPHAHIKKLVGSPYFSFRVGDYRLLLIVNNNKFFVIVIEVDHRKNVYKKLE